MYYYKKLVDDEECYYVSSSPARYPDGLTVVSQEEYEAFDTMIQFLTQNETKEVDTNGAE